MADEGTGIFSHAGEKMQSWSLSSQVLRNFFFFFETNRITRNNLEVKRFKFINISFVGPMETFFLQGVFGGGSQGDKA